MTHEELIDDFRREFEHRRFVAGLLLAFIGFLRELDAIGGGFADLNALLVVYPLSTTTARGTRANTLVVAVPRPGQSDTALLSIRPAYNEAERYFRVEQKRFDYPNCAPHATQAWTDYRHWLDALLALDEAAVAAVEASVRRHVLESLPSHDIDPSQMKPLERRFSRLLEEFPLTRQGREPQGAAFQGVIYGYIRADAPHLHLDITKAGAGSKRLQRVGDVDGWDGERLVLSAEVKHFAVGAGDVGSLEPFLAEVTRRNALALVAAESFAAEADARIAELGGRCLGREDLIRLVDLWDPLKQRAALQAFLYYVHHIEKSMPLIDRVRTYLADREPDADIGAATDG